MISRTCWQNWITTKNKTQRLLMTGLGVSQAVLRRVHTPGPARGAPCLHGGRWTWAASSCPPQALPLAGLSTSGWHTWPPLPLPPGDMRECVLTCLLWCTYLLVWIFYYKFCSTTIHWTEGKYSTQCAYWIFWLNCIKDEFCHSQRCNGWALLHLNEGFRGIFKGQWISRDFQCQPVSLSPNPHRR